MSEETGFAIRFSHGIYVRDLWAEVEGVMS